MKLYRATAAICFTTAGLLAQRAPVNLKSAGNYVILSETGITDVPPSVITGNVGASPITGAAIHLTCAEVTGTISAVDAAGPAPCALQVPQLLGPAILDMQAAYADAAGRTIPDFTELGAGNISGMTLAPGLYKWSTGVMVDNTGVKLTGGPNAVWIFQISGDLLLANNAHITLAGGAQANNVFWQVGGPTSVTFGTGVVFAGNLLSSKQVIMNTGATLNGRAYAFTQVTLQSTGITNPGVLVNGVPVVVPPTVSSTAPPNLSVGVPVGAGLTANFSEAMNPATLTAASFTVNAGLTPVTGTVSYVGVTATFTPSANLAPNTLYTATVTTAAMDPAGVALAANYVWTFTTGTTPDTTPPTVSSTVPASNATNVAVGSGLAATFSEPMNPLTIGTATFTLKQGLTPIAGAVTYVGVTATFTPLVSLAANTLFTATITTGAQDLSGNALASNYVWTFTTGAAPNTIPPSVSSTVPASNATNVAVGSGLAATFSEPMNPLTISTVTFSLKQGATPIAGAVSYAGVTATFTPLVSLGANTLFTATITTGAQDLSGNALASNYVWTFTTGTAPITTPPTVSSTVPSGNATNVAVGSALAATFSEAMNPLTISTATFTLKQGVTPIAGAVSYAGVTATFTPLVSLAANTLFTATITTGAQDLSGNALASNYVWTFTTGTAPSTTPPTVSSTVPASNATNVAVGSALAATFSEAMNPLTISTATFTLKQGVTPIAGAVTYVGVTATFTPLVSLAANTLFTATITTGAQDLSGNALASNYVWTFTTGATPSTTPPTVSSTVPAGNATNVAVGSALAATFSEAMNPLTISTATFTLKEGVTPIAGAVTYVGVTATFTPLVSLAANTLFTATITTGAQDLSGNALASNYAWTFTTGATRNTTAPTVIFTVPSNGASLITVTSNLAATFSEAMNPLTISTATFTLKQGLTPIAGAVSYVGVTATFTPLVNLAANTQFTATITTGAQDLSGNPLASNYVWTFATAASSNGTAPTVISTTPANGANLVTVTSNLVITFSEAMNPQTINTGTVSLTQGGTRVAGTVSYAGTTATFRPASNLVANSLYQGVISTGAADLSGNTLNATYLWSFTTSGSTADQTPVCLANFAVLSGSAIVGSGSNAVTGDIGVSPGTSVTGFPPGTLTGTIHAGDAAAAQAITGFTAAYGDAVSRSVGTVPVSGDLGGQTFTAGLYNSVSSLAISTGNLTLDAKGDVNAVFIFQMASTLTTSSGTQIVLAGGAQPFNVFWQVGSSATLGSNSAFNGSILANQSITLNPGASVNGRLLALNGVVTLQSDIVISPPPGIAVSGIVNAASDSHTVAAGSIAAVFGNDLGSSLLAATAYPLLTSLGGSTFTVGAQSAPLFMTYCSQANLQIPWEAAGQTQVPVTATVGGLVSLEQPAAIAPFAPGIFSINMGGSGQGAVEIAPTSLLAAPAGVLGRPVMPGEYIAIFCTGLGPVTNQPATGAAALSSPLSYTTTLPTVTLGGASVQVTYSGLAPGFAGLYQVNVLIPNAAPAGSSVNLILSIGGVQSNTVTIAVQ